MTLHDRLFREATLMEIFNYPSLSMMDESLKLALTQILEKLMNSKGEWTKRKMDEIFRLITKEIQGSYSSLLPAVQSDLALIATTVSLYQIPKAVMNEILDPNILVQGYTMTDLFKTLGDVHTQQLKVTFAAAVSRGTPISEIVSLMKEKHSSLSGSKLESAVITTSSEARARVRHYNYQKMEDEGLIEGYTYNATLDNRTTEYCRDHDGKTYWQPIDKIKGLINVHFRCRSVFVPTVKNAKQRASMFGPEKDIPYSQWFSDQDEAFQKLVLGPKKFKEYRDGTYKVGGMRDITGPKIDATTVKENLGEISFN